VTAAFFASGEEMRDWVESHHATATEFWVGIYKKGSGKAGVTFREALDQGMCFGTLGGCYAHAPCGAKSGNPDRMARLEDYSFGRLMVDGREHTRNLIGLPDRVLTDWWRRGGHAPAMEDLDEVLDELPARLVLGVGAYGGLRPDAAVIAELERRGVKGECLPTECAATTNSTSAAPRPRCV
jgi:hypothetical protein